MQKVFQRGLLDFLQTRLGLFLVICGAFWCLNTIIGLLHLLITTSTSPLCPHCAQNDYSDTLGTGEDSYHTITYPSGSLLPSTSIRSFESTLCYEPIDIVYTWVNGSDPKLIQDLAFWKAQYGEGDAEAAAALLASLSALNSTGSSNTTAVKQDKGDQASNNRFRDNQELRYSLRSIWKYAPWVRHVFVVTNGHVPYWLNLNHPRITLISHADIFPNKSHLPTFSSPAIESHLHRIPGLASKFIYFNDDVLLGNRITPDDFVTHGSGQKIFLSWNVPNCAPGCPDSWLADKYCDSACNNPDCEFDMGDCLNGTTSGGPNSDSRYGNWESSRGSTGAASSNARYCASGCPNTWVGDKVCDRACKNEECAFDGGDCGLELIKTHLIGIELPVIDDTLITDPLQDFQLPYGTASLYVNLSLAFPGETKITEANHDNPALVRSAIVTQNLKILTLIFYNDADISEDGGALAHGDMASLDELGANVGNTTTTPSTTSATDSTAHTTDSAATTSTNDALSRRVEIYLQGELNGVSTNITFNITRPRFPSAEDLAAAAAMEAAAAEVAASNPNGAEIVTDPEAMFAAMEQANHQAGAAAGTSMGAGSGDQTTTTEQMDSTRAAALDEAATRNQATIPTDDSGDWTENDPLAADGTRPGSRRRLLTVFDSLVGKLKTLSGGKTSTATSLPPSPPAEKVDPDAPFQPPAGYSGRPFPNSPASATKQKGQVASYHSSTFTIPRPDTIYESWQDMPVYIDSVPISSDIAHSGVKLRESSDDTNHVENLWQSKSDDVVPTLDDIQQAESHHALHDATGRVIESYGWTISDHELAARILQHKKKELWLMERDIARTNFMEAWRRSQVEKRQLLKGRWEQVWKEELEQKHAAANGGSSSSSFESKSTHPRFNRDPVWPWELTVAAPDLFEEWDWAAEAARFGKNSEVIARLQNARLMSKNKKQPVLGSTGTALDFELDVDESELPSLDDIEISLFGDDDSDAEASHSTSSPSNGMDLSTFGSGSTNALTPSIPISATHFPPEESEPVSLVDVSIPPNSGPRRTLLDVYGDSLRFVNNLYTAEFGREQRKAPAHMPHMIDVAIESELQARWPHLFDETSSHRFRHAHDMQYSFSYFYYLMNVPRTFSLHQVWEEQLDLDGDGRLNEIEIRYMTLWLSGKKILPRDLVKMNEKLLNITKQIYGYPYDTYNRDDPPRIDIEVLSRSGEILDLIEDKWSSLRKYQFELVNLDQIEFYMVPDNTTKVQLRLDEIRSKMPKFICLNDDMNKTSDPPPATLQALHDFYISYFPHPCPFENPEDQPNTFMYIDEWRREQHKKSLFWSNLKTNFMHWFSSSSTSASTGTAASPLSALSIGLITLLIGLFIYFLSPRIIQRFKRFIRKQNRHRSA